MEESPRLFQSKWDWRAILYCHLGAFVLMASWLWLPGRTAWEKIDYALFARLNFPLAHDSSLALFWALTNVRLCDIFVGAILLLIMCRHNWFFHNNEIRYAIFGLAGILLLSLVLRTGLHHLLAFSHWDTRSPSLKYDGAVRLTHLFHFWKLKDGSHDAFPGDHTGVLMIWGLLLSVYGRHWKLFAVWLLVMLFSLPRLVAGAHSISDDLVGGGFIALVSFAWGFYTPFTFWFSNFCDSLTRPVIRWAHLHLPLKE